MNKSEYSSILKKVPFRYIESLRIAKMMAEGFSFEKIQQSYLDFNEGKVVSEVRKKEVVNTLFVRLSNLDRVLLDQFIHADIATSKFILVYAIAKGDKLFSEFLLLCYRSALIGEKKYISLADFDDFFASEKEKNVSIAKWGRGTIEDLSTSYRNILVESGLAQRKVKNIHPIPCIVSPSVLDHIKEIGDEAYLQALTGAK